MKVVLFHPVHLPPRDYGGVERVVLWLAEALRDLGHEVHLAALEGSVPPIGVELLTIKATQKSAADLPAILPDGVEVIHFHAPPEKEFYELCSVPSLVTIHGNGKPGEVFPRNSVFLSEDHALRHGHRTFIYNGANPAEFHVAEKKSGHPLFLSKTSWKVKNLSGAIRIARCAGMPLTIAGGYRPFNLFIRDLFSKNAWVGSVAGRRKADCLAQASSLLFPVQWPEPFGLVMIEAMLSGAPVVASRIGSTPEVVGDFGGVLVEPTAQPQEWAAALRSVEKFDPIKLRERAIQKFSHHAMAASYLSLYKKVIQGDCL
ncbi:MAG: glycosyltransferase [Cryobacterium sp.]|nr:glycosyltransferase [Oligoflexia bacterium]